MSDAKRFTCRTNKGEVFYSHGLLYHVEDTPLGDIPMAIGVCPEPSPAQCHDDDEHVRSRLLVDVVREAEETYGKHDISQVLMKSRSARTPPQRHADTLLAAAGDCSDSATVSGVVLQIRAYIGDSAYAGANSDALDFAAAFAEGPKVLHYAALDALAFHGVGR